MFFLTDLTGSKVAPPWPWLSILQTRNSMIVWQMRMMENHHGCCNHMTLVIITTVVESKRCVEHDT